LRDHRAFLICFGPERKNFLAGSFGNWYRNWSISNVWIWLHFQTTGIEVGCLNFYANYTNLSIYYKIILCKTLDKEGKTEIY